MGFEVFFPVPLKATPVLFNNLDYKVKCVKNDVNGNLLILGLEINDYNITLVNWYGPNIEIGRASCRERV